MMNRARIQMRTWIATKNEHKANVQRRWDNRGKCTKHSTDGEKGFGTNMKQRRGDRRWGGKERERGRMELNIGVESGLHR
eukprot:1198178-Pleurochrysis_carterae.AAC.1